VIVATLCVGVQAARGRLPVELSTSGLRYEAEAAERAAAAVAELQEQYDDLLAVVDALADRLDAPQRRPQPMRSAMASQPTTAAPAPGSARELVEALRERNAPRRAEVQRSIASLRRIAEQLRAAAR
jgi:hypothetical protein